MEATPATVDGEIIELIEIVGLGTLATPATTFGVNDDPVED